MKGWRDAMGPTEDRLTGCPEDQTVNGE